MTTGARLALGVGARLSVFVDRDHDRGREFEICGRLGLGLGPASV
jgi:hypothetical protein